MIDALSSGFDETLNEEAESPSTIAAYTSLNVGARDWTVDTIVDQIKKGNIDLDPSFQRRNAWNDQKRSRFVESLILGVPIPQIVLAEVPNERGKFLVIDGKQRLLTLAGLTIDEYSFWTRDKFIELNTLTALNDVSISAFMIDPAFENERRYFSNAPIRCAVLAGSKDRDVFYDIFYRLNSGAVPLSGQELRQVFYKGSFARYLFDVTSTLGPLHALLSLDQPDPRLFDIELLLRYLSLKLGIFEYRGDLRRYLDQNMERITNEWDSYKSQVEQIFAELNELLVHLDSIFGYNAIGRKFTSSRLERRFNKAVFEVQAYYFSLLPEISLRSIPADHFLKAFETLCDDAEFRRSIEATTKSVERFRLRFDRFRELMNTVYKIELNESPPVSG